MTWTIEDGTMRCVILNEVFWKALDEAGAVQLASIRLWLGINESTPYQPRFELPAEHRQGSAPFLSKAQIRTMVREAEADLPSLRTLVAEFEREAATARGWARVVTTKLWQARARMRIAAQLPAFILIAYYTAARRRSVEALMKVQVDVKNSRINLQPPFGRPTNKRRPIVPIYPEIRPALKN